MTGGSGGASRGNEAARACPELLSSPHIPLVPWLFWWDVFPCGHGPMLLCSPWTHVESQGSPQAAPVSLT